MTRPVLFRPHRATSATAAASTAAARRRVRRARALDRAATGAGPLAALTLSVASVASLVFLVAAALLSGCAATTTPAYDRQFGDASRALMAQQVLDPGAPSRHAAKGSKVDGRLTREAGVRLVDSYKAPPPSNVINIGVGAGATDR